MNSKRKFNIASYRVLKTLLAMYEDNYTMQELINWLDKHDSAEYNNFVVSKYINTCRGCGIDIQKYDGKYSLVNFPFGSKWTNRETKLLCDIENFTEILSPDELDIFHELLFKLHIPYYKSANGLKSSENYRMIKLFEKACAANSNVEMFFSDGTSIICSPEEISVKDEKIYFKGVCDSKKEIIDPNNLVDIKLVSSSAKKAKYLSENVEFILKGKLAKRYQPRENEMITLFKRNGDIVVTNKYEDKKTLLRRLMRYGSLCKVLRPKQYVDDMKKMVIEALDNYFEN